ncbi:MAG: hypothetical protein IJ737_07505 [Ruminococcus sp.]|nr:hypothetical protein [Ruminococcus sp.]
MRAMKILSLCLAGTMALGALSGCAKKNKDSSSSAKGITPAEGETYRDAMVRARGEALAFSLSGESEGEELTMTFERSGDKAHIYTSFGSEVIDEYVVDGEYYIFFPSDKNYTKTSGTELDEVIEWEFPFGVTQELKETKTEGGQVIETYSDGDETDVFYFSEKEGKLTKYVHRTGGSEIEVEVRDFRTEGIEITLPELSEWVPLEGSE